MTDFSAPEQAPAGLSVFVYGTLKPGGMYYRQACEALQPEAIPAWIEGRLYHLPGLEYPAVTAGSDRIQGFVLRFKDSEILEALDEIEEYNAEQPETGLYLRHWLTVQTESGPLEAWGYLMTEARVTELGGSYLPSGVWAHC